MKKDLRKKNWQKKFFSRLTIARWENGNRLLDSAMIFRFAKILETDLNALFSAALESEDFVEDNGQGFNTEKVFEKSLTLSNKKNRLKIMCGGKLKIKSCEGCGTIVKIFVPFQL